jgi:hypothetical protein
VTLCHGESISPKLVPICFVNRCIYTPSLDFSSWGRNCVIRQRNGLLVCDVMPRVLCLERD